MPLLTTDQLAETHRNEPLGIIAAAADEDRHDTFRHSVPRSLEVGVGRATSVAETSSGTTKSQTPGDERSYCATVMVACTPQNPAIAAGATYPFTTNFCHPSKFHGASNASAKATVAGAAAQERTDTGTAIDPHRARGVAGGDAVAPARAGNQRTADRGDSPLAGTQQPEPMMIRIPCSECEGRGLFTLGNSIDPYAKLYECEQCGGDGFLEVEDEECEA